MKAIVATAFLVGACKSGANDANVRPDASSVAGEMDANADADRGDAKDAAGPPAAPCNLTPTRLVDLGALAADVGANMLYGVPVAVDATDVYFSYDGRLMSVPTQGGPVTTLARLPTTALTSAPIVVPGGVVLHTLTGTGANGMDEEILNVPKDGGAPVRLALVLNGVVGLAADRANAYFIDHTGTKSVPLTGGPVTVINNSVTASTALGGLAPAGAMLVVPLPCCGESAAAGTVVGVPFDGGPPVMLATGQPNGSFPMICGTDVCWWTGQTPEAGPAVSGPGAIARLVADGGVTALPGAPYYPFSLSFDGVDFYEAALCDDCAGTLLRIPAAGGPPVPMGVANYATVDDQCVYFSTRSGIFSVSKSYVSADGG